MTRTPVLVVLLVGVSALPAGVALAEDEGPLADAGLDQKAEVGETVLLDATGSRAPGEEITGYEWRIETPGGYRVTPTEPTNPRTRFIVHEAGRYNVTITIRDESGSTASDTLYVYVVGNLDGESESETFDSSTSPTQSTKRQAAPKKPDFEKLPDQYQELKEKFDIPDTPEPTEPNQTKVPPGEDLEDPTPDPGKPKRHTTITAVFDHYSEHGSVGFDSNKHYKDSTGMGKSGVQGWVPEPNLKTGTIEGMLFGRESYIAGKVEMSGKRASSIAWTLDGRFRTAEYRKGASDKKSIGYDEVHRTGPNSNSLKNYDKVSVRYKVAEGTGMMDSLAISEHFTRNDYENSRSDVSTAVKKSVETTQNTIEATDDTVSNVAASTTSTVSSTSEKVENTLDGKPNIVPQNNSKKSGGVAPWPIL